MRTRDPAGGYQPRHPHHHPTDLFDPNGESGPAEPGPGRPRGRGPRRSGGPGRRRAPRGDVRTAILLLLAEEPMHGYQLMQAVAERSGGRWTPSPGAVYPAINQLEDEELVTATSASGRKLVTLTDSGRALVDTQRDSWPDPFAGFGGPRRGPDLRALLEQLHGAARQVGRTGTEPQVQAAATILANARRDLYLLLAEGPEATDGSAATHG